MRRGHLAPKWDAGVPLADVQAGLDSLGITGLRLETAEVKKKGFRALKLTVHHEPEDDLTGGGVGCGSNKSYVGRMGTPPEYRAMWRTVRQRFDAQ